MSRCVDAVESRDISPWLRLREPLGQREPKWRRSSVAMKSRRTPTHARLLLSSLRSMTCTGGAASRASGRPTVGRGADSSICVSAAAFMRSWQCATTAGRLEISFSKTARDVRSRTSVSSFGSRSNTRVRKKFSLNAFGHFFTSSKSSLRSTSASASSTNAVWKEKRNSLTAFLPFSLCTHFMGTSLSTTQFTSHSTAPLSGV
mmetsp:Transcript_35767/g.89750  ORF Transcript_35767/g.89750 Transcript_35767/m.89750 type:complete len:203 (+) Transcript_35767:1424-2032(+)